MKDYNRESLEMHRANVETALKAWETAQKLRDDYIRGMVETDWHPTQIAAAAGISRERVYQIRDKRR